MSTNTRPKWKIHYFFTLLASPPFFHSSFSRWMWIHSPPQKQFPIVLFFWESRYWSASRNGQRTWQTMHNNECSVLFSNAKLAQRFNFLFTLNGFILTFLRDDSFVSHLVALLSHQCIQIIKWNDSRSFVHSRYRIMWAYFAAKLFLSHDWPAIVH